MEVLSPKSANTIVQHRTTMKRSRTEPAPKPADKPVNPDRIDDRWRPPAVVTEPGSAPETYVTGKKLGKGGFAVCFEGRTSSTSQLYALKVVKAHVQQKKMMEKFRTEMQIHAKMQHPNIVEFLRAFTLEGHTYVVLELCNNGSLTEMVKVRGCLSLPEVRRYMIQICGGVKYMHRRSVIHRDLKMGNIFIDAQMNLKIGDFGLAAVMADDQDRRTTLCGTPNYIAPEILSKSGTRGHDFKVDTWAVGVIAYAMLTGMPPFQSKTQQEIYNKLKGLDYGWKTDGINHIPQEAKDLVTSCLNLNAAERPDMDDLVEQEFFKIGMVADVLDSSCLRSKPVWLLNSDPRGDRVKPGSGIDHGILCAQCGVGRSLDGRSRAPVGGKAKLSALMEIELENRQGTAPTTPLAEGILYTRFKDTAEVMSATLKQPMNSLPRGRKPIEMSITHLTDSTQPDTLGPANDFSASSTSRARRVPLAARPAQSFAAQQRQQALPRTMLPPTMHPSQEVKTVHPEISENKSSELQGLLKARPVRATSTRNARGTVDEETSSTRPSAAADSLGHLSARLMQETDDTMTKARSLATERKPAPGPMSLPSRPRTLRSRAKVPEEQEHAVKAALSESANVAASTQNETSKSTRNTSHKPAPRFEETGIVEQAVANKFELPKYKSSFKPRLIASAESYMLVPDSSHAKVIQSLRTIHRKLGRSGEKMSAPGSRTTPFQSRLTYPRVDKWVDYATKHGIAYILTDGSLGMILKSRDKESASSACIVVRDAQQHTIRRACSTEHQLVPQGPDAADVEFYEQVDAAFATKRLDVRARDFYLDLDHHDDQSTAAQALLKNLRGSAAQRVKEVGLLDKFGRYMNKQMGTSDLADQPPKKSSTGHFIHFYQRMGNVGVWRFVDGGMQFNFPDHTKLVVYQHDPVIDEVDIWIDAVCLDPRDARDLSAHGVLTNECLERRTLRTFALADIQSDGLPKAEQEVVRTNQIREKLSWIRAIIGCWIKEGGLGRTGDENKLGWSGMQEQRTDKKVKLQWVTVGRPGGDDPPTAS